MGLRMLEAAFITSHTKACVFNHDFLGTKSGKTLFLVYFLLGKYILCAGCMLCTGVLFTGMCLCTVTCFEQVSCVQVCVVHMHDVSRCIVCRSVLYTGMCCV